MAKILMTPERIDRGVRKLQDMVATLGRQEMSELSAREVRRFKGRGKALLERLYRYAGHIDATRARARERVDRAAFQAGAVRLGNALKRIAMTKGDKDGMLSGTDEELGRASKTAQSLARWIHANVR